MATNYPGAKDTWDDPAMSTLMNAPGFDHTAAHGNVQDAVEAIETFVGTSGSPGPALTPYATTEQLAAYAPVATIKTVRDLSVPSPAASRIDPNLAVARRVTSPLTIPTGYTGNDIVEPELLYDPDASLWGSRYLLIAAPYYQSNAALENPSLWVSNDGTTWTVPAGVTNPIYPSGVGGAGYGNNSDPSILLGNDGQLYMLFNEFFPSGNWGVRAASCPPSNLAGWDAAPTTVVSTAIGTSRSTSPSGFYDPALGEYVFYSIDIVPSPNVLQRWTSANPKTAWTLTTAPTFPTWPATGREMWHLNAYLIGDQHVLLISDTATGGSGPGNLYLAVSNDRGATWSIGQQPLIYGTGISGQWDQGLYRSAALPQWRGDQLTFDLFYGGNTNTNTWGIGRTTLTFAGLDQGQAITAKTKTGAGLYFAAPLGLNTSAMPNGVLRACPIYFDRTVTLEAIGAEVTAIGDATGPVIRFGIYADDGDGHPGRLILDAGTVSATATGWHEAAISLTLPAGMYWMAAVTQAVTTTAPTVRIYAGQAIIGLPGIGSATALTVSQNAGIGYGVTGITGALPDPFTTSPPASLGANAHRVLVKVT